MSAPRVAAVVPTYENPATVRDVVGGIREHGLEVVIVDDGSSAPGREACAELAREGLATVLRHGRNRGKGVACATGFEALRERGFTHAFQIDADGQHDLSRIPAFLDAARAEPRALVLAYPEYDASAPRSRLVARRFTSFWVALEVGGAGRVVDALIGFRIYPLAALEGLRPLAPRMGFDVDAVVRLARRGVPLVNLPVAVRYLQGDEGGVSHFRPLRDNLAFARLHSRLCMEGCLGWLRRRAPGGRR